MVDEILMCPVCYTELVWDSTGETSGNGFPCWYCTNCAFCTPPTKEFPAPE